MASLGQALIQASRPRSVLPPLQLGLACQLHYLFRSRFLVDTLHAMGFCSSYSEVQRFEKNAACSTAPDVLGGDINPSNTTVLFAADNVDHNTITIDGKGTFHGMGMIGAITPKRQTTHIVPRRNVSDINITEISKIEIEDYCAAEKVRSHINFQLLPERQASDANRVDILWEMSFHFRQPMPSWQGMMHIVHQGSDHPGQSSVIFLPMIDMYPGDKTCIYSTLHYLTKLASEHNINPVVTFDQPLFWKASEIINDAPESSCLKNVVLLLGSFHTFMNLLGAIGTLMGGSGLKNVLETAYGENAVGHMLTGKSVQRAFRGHLLVDKCLNREIANEVQKVDPTFALLVNELEKLHASLLSGETNLDALLNSDCLIKLEQMMDTKGSELSDRSKTSKLWLKYLWMLDIAKELIRADRTGSWQMHLHAVTECLPIFSAAGHSNYLKSAYLYLQNMHDLKTKSPRVYQKFENGFHVIRRSNQFWAGLGSDLVIEQTLMRSLKSTGGLTRGSGITEQQRAIWTLSSPVSAEYNSEMQTFTNLSYTTSEQHKEVATSRMNRDASDAAKIAEKLDGCSPFSPDESLRNIITGAVANDDVTVHELDTIGRRTVAKMVGHSVFSYSVKRSSRVKTMASVTAVKIDEEKSIDAALLFQRFLVVSHTADLSLEDVMSYELCPFPPSLFESKDLLRKADKPQIAEAIRTHVGSESNDAITEAIPATEHYVLDGGSLLHRLKWTDGSSYSSIAEDYANFTVHHYGKPTVIFDGYDGGPSIKDNTHLRRTRNQQQPTVNITETTQFAGKKEEILSNNKNKQTIINLISERLQQKGCDVKHSEGDADVDIVRTASALSKTMSTTVIGEDTDLLILLLHQASVSECKELYFRSDIQSRSRKIVYNIKQLKHKLGVDICTQLLFIYAFTGCDSTSRIFGIGKKSAFQKLIKGHSVLKECAKIFTTPGNDKTVIDKSGSNAMVTLFNGKQTVSLASIRYSMLSRKVATAKTFVTPERLPPTESASNLHSRRTYLQVMVWMGTSVTMHPVDWGWSLQEDKTRLIPVMMKKKAAPENLLKVVRCSCTCGCGTLRCSCKKYGLMCSAACGQCQVNICENMPTGCLWEEEDDEDRCE